MIDLALFRRFIPTLSLAPTERADLARHSKLHRVGRDQAFFRAGANSGTAVYLVVGSVRLEAADGAKRVIRAGSDDARYALSNSSRFETSCIALEPSEALFVDRERLDLALTWAQAGTVEVGDAAEGDDWMAVMLRAPALQRVPPANIVRVMAAIERVEFAAGETIIREGDPGEHYFVLVEGTCRVFRLDTVTLEYHELDQLSAGQAFGEEALVSGNPRNASVEAVTSCRLARLAARDFNRFLREPLLKTVTLIEAAQNAQRVDVRLPDEFAGGHLRGAINLPLADIRSMCSRLDRKRPVVVYCDGGRRSASAAFLLGERGFDASWVEGGVPINELSWRD